MPKLSDLEEEHVISWSSLVFITTLLTLNSFAIKKKKQKQTKVPEEGFFSHCD